MAKRVFQAVNWTPTATADATALTNSTYMALKGGSTTQLLRVSEIMVSGFAGASSPTIMQWARIGTVETTATALAAPNSDGPMHPATAALAAPAVSFVAASTGPARSSSTSDGRLDMSINAFGGIKRWVSAPDSEWFILGNVADFGEAVLSAFTGGTVGAVSSHIIYEPL
jgi:hypothetical protein